MTMTWLKGSNIVTLTSTIVRAIVLIHSTSSYGSWPSLLTFSGPWKRKHEYRKQREKARFFSIYHLGHNKPLMNSNTFFIISFIQVYSRIVTLNVYVSSVISLFHEVCRIFQRIRGLSLFIIWKREEGGRKIIWEVSVIPKRA